MSFAGCPASKSTSITDTGIHKTTKSISYFTPIQTGGPIWKKAEKSDSGGRTATIAVIATIGDMASTRTETSRSSGASACQIIRDVLARTSARTSITSAPRRRASRKPGRSSRMHQLSFRHRRGKETSTSRSANFGMPSRIRMRESFLTYIRMAMRSAGLGDSSTNAHTTTMLSVRWAEEWHRFLAISYGPLYFLIADVRLFCLLDQMACRDLHSCFRWI